ncbi:hypothetical protein ECPA9_0062 [Escherichia coli PA9]|nr:hypothetical protein ECPA9_0062 [Escherichia coli PA9]EIN69537.1 hypothetical protein ECPA14_5772 [Escherichia coli PA14]EIP49859.1 hypothetical protein ECEC4448_5680 [Escherichia coli EC4448]EKH53730.1 hypothetical protein ECNE1487_0183 [Escherichia coli NE1487]EKI82721.1 hypothetical protein ECEC1849_5584 [Escherichia coli EC1849]EKI91918.1 hypothetical protein ECEC1848_0127 [Escherichia coli EC1848]EKJ19871.1 hypothetical protein ECEC1864_0061 [Escherichia coli EC1864]EKW37841.1 hypoth
MSGCMRKDLNNASCGVLVVKFVMAIRHLLIRWPDFSD